MLHNKRHKPPPPPPYFKRKIKPKRLPWEIDMTLCIAAACREEETKEPRIVACTDARAETGTAGGDVAFKYEWLVRPGWQALMSGELSKAEQMAATFRTLLRPSDLDIDSVFDKLNEASNAHKTLMCDQAVRRRLGISFKRFLEKGEHELTVEVRNRMLYELEELDFGCTLLTYGFLKGIDFPYIFTIDGFGEVTHRQNFAAIGSGGMVAESVLYQRHQDSMLDVDATLYHVYEAAKLTYMSGAPGVGEIKSFMVLEPTADRTDIRGRMVKPEFVQQLEFFFGKYGPKPLTNVPVLSEEFYEYLKDSTELKP